MDPALQLSLTMFLFSVMFSYLVAVSVVDSYHRRVHSFERSMFGDGL